MRYVKVFLLTAALAYLCGPPSGHADIGAVKVRRGQTTQYTMCNAQTGTGVCTAGAPADQVVAQILNRVELAFYSGESTATTYTCNAFENNVGHDAASGVGQQLNVSPITETNRTLHLLGTFGFVWINCSGINGGNVTIRALSVPVREGSGVE